MDEKRNVKRKPRFYTAKAIQRKLFGGVADNSFKILIKDNVSQLIAGLFFTLVNFVFARCSPAFGAFPLGTAFFCATVKHVPFSFAGLIISSLFSRGSALQLFLTYSALFLGRYIIYRRFGMESRKFKMFAEPLNVRILCGGVAALLISLYRYTASGFLMYDLFGGMFEVGFVPIFTYLFSSLFEKNKYIKKDFARIIFLSAFIFAAKTFDLPTFSFACLAAYLVSLVYSKKEGMLKGGIYSLVCGLAWSPLYSPVFALCSIVSGMLWKVSNAVAVSLSCIAGILLGLYVGGADSLITFAPAILFASVAFLPFVQFGLFDNLVQTVNEKKSKVITGLNSIISEKKNIDTSARIEAISNSFGELSKVFYNLSDRMKRPAVYDIRLICEREFDKVCHRCVMKQLCREKDAASNAEIILAISKELENNGYAESKNLPEYIQTRCSNINRIVEEINSSHASMIEMKLKANKTEVFAMDYESISKLLREVIAKNAGEYVRDENISAKLLKRVRSMRLPAANVSIYGTRKKTIIAGDIELSRVSLPASEIRSAFEEICGLPLTEPKFDMENEFVSMTLESVKKFNAEFSMASGRKEKEHLNGDVICVFENREGYFYALLSDGMGSGREAAMSSRICGLFLEKMLSAGNGKAVTIEMLNNFLRSKDNECFATVDLLEIDLLNGKAGFVKSGSASSYILRKDKIFRISSKSMPVGIIAGPNTEEINFTLEDGDYVIMLSDGIGGQTEENLWITNMLTYEWEDDIDLMSEKILRLARDKCERADDMTVGIIKVKEV